MQLLPYEQLLRIIPLMGTIATGSHSRCLGCCAGEKRLRIAGRPATIAIDNSRRKLYAAVCAIPNCVIKQRSPRGIACENGRIADDDEQ